VKLRYLVGLVVVWNVCCALGIYLNGGQGRIRTPASALVIVSTVAGFAAGFFVLRSNDSVQAVVLKPAADLAAVEQFALHTAIILTVLAVIFAGALALSVPPS